MPHSVSDKLGQYEILSLLGKGGMGEGHRERDTKLWQSKMGERSNENEK